MVKLGGGEPRVTSHQPHLSLLYGTARWGPTSRVGLGVLDQDASQGPRWPLGQLEEINPTRPDWSLQVAANFGRQQMVPCMNIYNSLQNSVC